MEHSGCEGLKLAQAGERATLQEQQQALYLILEEFDRVCGLLQLPYVLFAGTLIGAVRHQGFVPWDDDIDVLMLREDYERFLEQAPALLDGKHFFLQKEFSPHWPLFFSKLRLNGTTCLETYHPKDKKSHQGLYMDIFPCDNARESKLGQYLQFASSKVVIAKGLDRRGYEASFKKKVFMLLCRLLPGKPFFRFVKGPRKQGSYVHSFFGAASKFSKNIYPSIFFRERVLLPFERGQFPAPKDYDRLLTIVYGDYMALPAEGERRCKRHSILVDLTRSYEHYEHYRDGMKFDALTRSIR